MDTGGAKSLLGWESKYTAAQTLGHWPRASNLAHGVKLTDGGGAAA
jgi:hypothetical protein